MKKFLAADLIYLLMATLALPTTANGEIYKWKDEDGEIHYSQTAPADVKAEIIDIPSDNGSEAGRSSLERQLFEAEKNKTRRKMMMEEQRNAAEEKAFREDNCKRSQVKFESLNSGTNILELDEQGHARRLTEQERQTRINNAKNDILRWCAEIN